MFSHTTFLTRKRRSVRKYAKEKIKPEVLEDILEAGLRAPTSKNNRATRFIVVEDPNMLQALSECRERGALLFFEAGLRAPTSKNNRATRFIVVEDPNMLQALSECRERGSAFLAEASLAIVVCSDSEKSRRPYSDCAVAAAFMQLAVTDNDLGSCWCHIEDSPSPKGATAEEYIKYKLDLPDSYKVLTVIGIGEVAEEEMLKPREREVEWERTYIGRYEERGE